MKWMLFAAAAAVTSAAPAHADDITYLDDLKAAGFDQPHNGNGGMIESGHGIRRALAAGASPEQIAQYLYENSHLSSLDEGRQLVGIARQDLCNG
jgi:Protein of unknown function (DUF732)